MKVRKLIEKLSQFDDDLDVVMFNGKNYFSGYDTISNVIGKPFFKNRYGFYERCTKRKKDHVVLPILKFTF